ncbi:hypothetical protein GobsT_28830 [Gemmata obscuriglobus]|uniref:Uncharacterized protein n=1 Tax=Gemmata obscuriglobus TaxID=114 RepID=A0A2Z3GWS5_9BACT|nr:hypothetical protein [Gemmata obscuriglobus]AWM38889.1 hypothetical protein C1280_19130 [Gemmata obscuriglobus]QEG28109.1 hypothetical protein GobsT_28830 [Gemmata obscuriglobus]VTS05751.1 Uncharacterized protein OS=Saccharibacillus sacchari DSM 19268 GN=SacsacDRAFT_0296 PE=4 SV=1 [Gemmata obscuriglobus UQM 2246]
MFHILTATDADQRLAELERFIQHWYGPRRPEFGEPDALAGYPELPGSLRRFYSFAGQWPSPNPDSDAEYFYTGGSGHHLLPLAQASPTVDGRLRFFMEYQGDWYGVTTPGEPDPPVWITGRWDEEGAPEGTEDGPEPQAKTRQVSAALSRFLVTHCLMTTVYEWDNSPHPRTSSHAVDTALADWLRRERASAEVLWAAEPGGCPNYEGSFLLLHGRVLVHDTGSGFLKFGARHPEGIELLRGVIGDAV